METNGLDHAGRGEGIHPEVFYLQPAHTCTHITSRITTLCGKAATVHTFSIHTLHTAQMVLLRFIWQSTASQAHAEL